jgi:hypothetical protein
MAKRIPEFSSRPFYQDPIDGSILPPQAVLVVFIASHEVKPPFTSRNGVLDGISDQDDTGAQGRKLGVETGVVKIQALPIIETEHGGDCLLVALQDVKPKPSLSGEGLGDISEEGLPFLIHESLLFGPAFLVQGNEGEDIVPSTLIFGTLAKAKGRGRLFCPAHLPP